MGYSMLVVPQLLLSWVRSPGNAALLGLLCSWQTLLRLRWKESFAVVCCMAGVMPAWGIVELGPGGWYGESKQGRVRKRKAGSVMQCWNRKQGAANKVRALVIAIMCPAAAVAAFVVVQWYELHWYCIIKECEGVGRWRAVRGCAGQLCNLYSVCSSMQSSVIGC